MYINVLEELNVLNFSEKSNFATNWEHKIKYFILFFKNEAQNFIIQVGILIPTYNWNQKL